MRRQHTESDRDWLFGDNALVEVTKLEMIRERQWGEKDCECVGGGVRIEVLSGRIAWRSFRSPCRTLTAAGAKWVAIIIFMTTTVTMEHGKCVVRILAISRPQRNSTCLQIILIVHVVFLSIPLRHKPPAKSLAHRHYLLGTCLQGFRGGLIAA